MGPPCPLPITHPVTGSKGRRPFAGSGSARSSLTRLRHRRAFAAHGGAMHVADFLRIERAGAMHGGSIVPHHEVPLLPFVGIDELALRGVLDEVAQEGAGF